MDITRKEIMPGVALTCLRSRKFKTACMSLSLLTQLERENASMNALIPFVLRRGTTQYPDMQAISRRLEELYGAAIEPVVRRVGEIQCIGFYASMAEDEFLPGGEGLLRETAQLMGQLLLSPVTRGGLFLPEYVDSERDKLCERIASLINDKRRYAMTRCIEEMCCYENYAVGRFGSVSDCEGINYKKLTRRYRTLLQTSPVEIFYCGRSDDVAVERALRDALAALPRGEVDYDIGTDVRMNAVEAEPRFAEEAMDVAQGVLSMGFRLGDAMDEANMAALYVFNGVFGSGTTSKLFANVRERLQLCYYAFSTLDVHKGIMLVTSGIEFDKFDQAKNEILTQLEEIKNGNITDAELDAAKAGVASALRAGMDGHGELESFFLSQTLLGLDNDPEELAELAESVTADEIVAIAKGIECDMVYFLTGGGESDDDDNDDEEESDAQT